MYKNNSRNSSKFKGYNPLQLSCNLTGKCHAICHYSYNLPFYVFKIYLGNQENEIRTNNNVNADPNNTSQILTHSKAT